MEAENSQADGEQRQQDWSIADLTLPKPERIKFAIEDVTGGMTQTKAALKWNVHRVTLIQCLKNPNHSFVRPTVILTDMEEKVLAEWADDCARRGFPRSQRDIIDAAFDILYFGRKGSEAVKPTVGWLRGFSKRQNFKLRQSQILSYASGCLTREDLLGWFARVRAGILTEGLEDLMSKPSRIYNADESGFLLNASSGKVLVKKGTGNAFEVKKNEKECLTVMLLIRADGKVCKPFIVYPTVRIPSSITNNFPHETAFKAGTDNGWMTGETFCEFLLTVAADAKENGVDLPREKVILYVDNHSSHLTIKSRQLSRELGICMIGFYPNATFIIQPADVACFRSLKSHWKEEVRLQKRKFMDKNVFRAEFAEVFMRALKKLKPETVQKGFEKCGLYPWQPEALDYSKCIGQKKNPEAPSNSEELIDFFSEAPANNSSSSSSEEFTNLSSDISVSTEDIEVDLVTAENIQRQLTGTLPATVASQLFDEMCRRVANGTMLIGFKANSTIERQPKVPLSPEVIRSTLPTPTTAHRQNKRQTKRTSDMLSSDESIGVLESAEAKKKATAEQVLANKDKKILKRKEKLIRDANKLKADEEVLYHKKMERERLTQPSVNTCYVIENVEEELQMQYKVIGNFEKTEKFQPLKESNGVRKNTAKKTANQAMPQSSAESPKKQSTKKTIAKRAAPQACDEAIKKRGRPAKKAKKENVQPSETVTEPPKKRPRRLINSVKP